MTSLDDLKEGIELFGSWNPNIDIGEYTLTVKQTVDHHKDGGAWVFEPPPQKFTIGALRFSLTTSDVLACFPAPGSSTPSGRLLPYVSLRDPYLPWESRKCAPSNWGKAPSMALLVFADSEIAPDDLKTGQTSELLSQTPDGRLRPDLGSSDLPKAACTTLDLSPTDLLQHLPNPVNELPLLAHVRREIRTGVEGPEKPVVTPAHSAVISNRFPRTTISANSNAKDEPCHYTAHLVSLLGHENHLVDTEALMKSTKVRLVSLWSWQFTISAATEETYADAFSNMHNDSNTKGKNRLRFTPSQPVSQKVAKRLEAGYIPMPNRVATGENTAAWYRGPLGPWPPAKKAPSPQHTPFSCADEALVYSTNEGMLDISLAAAWNIGFQLVLSRRDLFGQLLTLQSVATHYALTLAMTARSPAGPAHFASAETLEADVLTDMMAPTPMRQRFDAMMTGAKRTTGSNRLGDDLTKALTEPSRQAVAFDSAPTPVANPDHSHPLVHHAAALLERPDVVSTLKRVLRQRHLHEAAEPEASEEKVAFDISADDNPPDTWLWDAVDLLGFLPPWYLVPMADAALPPDSIRFFSIDERWLSALADGMLAVGTHTTLDHALIPHLADVVFKPRHPDQDPACGLLMRSAIVRAWPHHPTVSKDPGGTEPVADNRDPGYFTIHGAKLITRTQISPDTVLLLFDKCPKEVTLQEPGHVLQFGLDGTDSKKLRDASGTVQGTPLKVFDDLLYDDAWPGHRREILKVTDLAKKLCNNVTDDPASFAYQMLNPPACLEIKLPVS
ncbi:hypothetical protein [Streptomyces wuyuanensis]|uniref:hypothetical protein n=1 Tax=Streptomyces wuyuanensis TaxID=1196353 RepID=UPI00342DACD6